MVETVEIANAIIVGVTVVISFFGFQSPSLIDRTLFSSNAILVRRQYWRLFTSGFVHADWGHLAFNMFSLYSFGGYVEQYFGMGTFLAVYFISLLGGSLLALALHRQHEYRALGASGAVCGVIFASILLQPGGSVFLMFIPVPIPSWLYAVIFVLISMKGIHSQAGNIGHEAHLGGAFAGLLLTTLMYPGIIQQSPLLYAVVMIVITLYLVFVIKPSWFGIRPSKPSSRATHLSRGPSEEDRQFIEHLRRKIVEQGADALTPEEKQKLMSMTQQDR
jgi:membrane associated rhomboid family serine protease